MDIKTCPCCGAIIPTPNEFGLSPTERRVYEFIAKHPDYNLEAITNGVYPITYDGGPRFNIINVWICKINKKLRGQRIVSTGGYDSRYRLIKLKDPADAAT